MSRSYRILFDGKLDDAPGRMESWTEYLRYLGRSRWELLIEGTDFSGSEEITPERIRLGSEKLVNWAVERDGDDAGDAENADLDGRHETPSNEVRVLGPRARCLLKAAEDVGASYCVKLLKGWQSGTWPRPSPPPRVLRVKGVAIRGWWTRVYRPSFDVETTAGDGYMSPPAKDGTASLRVATCEPGSWKIRLPRRLWGSIRALKPELEALRCSQENS